MPHPRLLLLFSFQIMVFLLLLLLLLSPSSAFLFGKPRSRPPSSKPPSIHTRLQAAVATAATTNTHSEAFHQIVHARFSNSHYNQNKPIPSSLLATLLSLTQRAPSSFNIQPYRLILLQDPQLRDKIATQAMLGANGGRVRTAPVTVVFAADLESSRLMPKVVNLFKKTGTFPEAFLKNIPFFGTLFSTGFPFSLVRWGVYWGKRIAMTLLGLIKPVPRFERPETWAAKNTMLAAMTFMLAASAHGLSTCPMEGFDATRLRKLLKLPSRYIIPVVISVGYQAEKREETDKKEGEGGKWVSAPSLRFPMEEVVCEDEYGRPWSPRG